MRRESSRRGHQEEKGLEEGEKPKETGTVERQRQQEEKDRQQGERGEAIEAREPTGLKVAREMSRRRSIEKVRQGKR